MGPSADVHVHGRQPSRLSYAQTLQAANPPTGNRTDGSQKHRRPFWEPEQARRMVISTAITMSTVELELPDTHCLGVQRCRLEPVATAITQASSKLVTPITVDANAATCPIVAKIRSVATNDADFAMP
eukprot:TRINITY_DN12554_c0_g3_i1.p2 TRINITY_DN12554_c0_g3~~TRINITY_DN12554_c0_g3_i1.p2  ORF type:complete len:128 (-),score=15.82 TRINITY_DN12554_c0_g3_i1:119-502(-)